ncbi:hypothetical protein [uncultured Gimesia sp.]|uniref:hypothetical protein n=1 Tax=uncultured Gimesia sp. TaxID=1678688 RepID=UPI0026102223|nr:hypothetical protein [uncultured Gimesia sp.]
MSKKIIAVVSLVLVICSISVVGLVWTLVKQNQEVNQHILKQLDEIKQVQQSQSVSASDSLSQVAFQLVQDKKDGKPAVGFRGKLTKGGKQLDTFALEAVSDESGTLDFGKLPWGRYDLDLCAPWGGSSLFRWSSGESYQLSDLMVLPGRDFPSSTIDCPAAAPKAVPVKFQVTWPEGLNTDNYYLLCDFSVKSGDNEVLFASTRVIQQETWLYIHNDMTRFGVFLINNQNHVQNDLTLSLVFGFEDFMPEKFAVEKPSIKMLEGQYILPAIYLVRKDRLKSISKDLANNVYSAVLNHERDRLVFFQPLPKLRSLGDSFKKDRTTTFLFPFHKNVFATDDPPDSKSPPKIKIASGIELSELLEFHATTHQDNIWKIDLPELKSLIIPEGIGGTGTGLY